MKADPAAAVLADPPLRHRNLPLLLLELERRVMLPLQC